MFKNGRIVRLPLAICMVGIKAVSYIFFSRGKENGKSFWHFPEQGDCLLGVDTLKWNKIVSQSFKA